MIRLLALQARAVGWGASLLYAKARQVAAAVGDKRFISRDLEA